MDFYLWMTIKVAIGIIIVISYLNITGRNQIALMTSVDLVGNFILGGVIGGAIYNNDLPLTQYIALLFICVVVMALCNYAFRKISFLRKMTIGTPLLLIKNGQFLMDNIKNNASRIDLRDVATAMRMQNIFSFEGINYAQLETTGHVSIIREKDVHPSDFVILNGLILNDELEKLGVSEEWLHQRLAASGFTDTKTIFLAEWIYDHMLIIDTDGKITSSPPSDPL